MIFLLIAVSAWCAEESTLFDSRTFSVDQRVFSLPRVVQNSTSTQGTVRRLDVNPECLPKSLTSFKVHEEENADSVALTSGSQELTITLPHQIAGGWQSPCGGCLLRVMSKDGEEELYSHITWCNKTTDCGGLALCLPYGGALSGEFYWGASPLFRDFSEYDFGLEGLYVTRIVRVYNNGDRFFVRAQASYANLKTVTLSWGEQKAYGGQCSDVILTLKDINF